MSPPVDPSGPLPRDLSEPQFGGLHVPLVSLLAFLLRSVEHHHFAAHHHDVEHPLLRRLDLPQLALDLPRPHPGARRPEISIAFSASATAARGPRRQTPDARRSARCTSKASHCTRRCICTRTTVKGSRT